MSTLKITAQSKTVVDIEKIKITNTIFVEHKFQKELIIEQDSLIAIQDSIINIDRFIIDNYKTNEINIKNYYENRESLYKQTILNNKKEKRITTLGLVVSLILNGVLLLK